MSKVIIIPKDNVEVNQPIPDEVRLSEEMREQMVELHKTNPLLYQLIVQDAEAVNKAVLDISKTGDKLDFSWKEYTLRDVVIRQTVARTEFMENLRMLELTDVESSKMLKDLTDEFMEMYVTILLYYGAPADSEYAFSHVRFIDVIGSILKDKTGADSGLEPTLRRRTFLRYTREL